MTDLTLYEYRDLPEEELKRKLREEARLILGSDSCENRHVEPDHGIEPLSPAHRYWARFINFISSFHIPIHGGAN